MKKPKFNTASPLSWILFGNLRKLYNSELKAGIQEKKSKNGIHFFTLNAINAFPLAVATWEAVISEMFFRDLTKWEYESNLLYEIFDETERWDLIKKTTTYPKFLFNCTFDKSTHYFANFKTIIQVRNNIIHYKHSLNEGPDKALRNLNSLKVTYPKPNDIGCPWHMELASTECIRFCINTISQLCIELSNLQSDFFKKECVPIALDIFKKIDHSDVLEIFKKYNSNPNSIENDMFRKN